MRHAHNVPIAAFAPGDGLLRAPVASGLPTLESHRALHPPASALALRGLGFESSPP